MSKSIAEIEELWRAGWPTALSAWSRFTRLQMPEFCVTRRAAAREGLTGSFAMIRLADQRVVIDLETVRNLELEEFGVEILAHEIGHHVYAPATATEHFRLIARIRRGLPTLEAQAARVANLYTDLHINDRLQRQANLRMAEVFARLHAKTNGEAQNELWTLYLRIYEHLWRLDRGSLGAVETTDRIETDAWLGARLIRVYARDWMEGAGRFAALLLPYLVNETGESQAIEYLHDTREAARDCVPSGMQQVEEGEIAGAIHPAEDAAITGEEGDETPVAATAGPAAGQAREPFEYGEILKAAGIQLPDHDIAIRYYRERAWPHLVPFPSLTSPDMPEPMPEGLEPWAVGDPLDEVDWLESVIVSPHVIPGMTTMRRVHGPMKGELEQRQPVDLDLYVDSSGSMPNPQQVVSYLTLAGAIIALSALRSGSRVQVTLWSGKNQFLGTAGFVREEVEILRVLTGYYGGSTCFPIHRLRETYEKRAKLDRPVHILQISDDGITTMFDADEQGNSGWDVAAQAMAKGCGGGTMVLNLRARNKYNEETWAALDRASREQGWVIEPIEDWEQLAGFARRFAQRHYAPKPAAR